MKNLLCLSCTLALATASLNAATIFSDDFNSYSAGSLVGQTPWAQTGTITTSPIQVGSGAVTLYTGQDAYAPLPGGPVILSDYSSLMMDVDINVATARTGDYFLHYSTSIGNSSIFPDRLYVKAATGGYVLGWAASSSGVVYGSTVLSLNQVYHVTTVYTALPGAGNDKGALYVNNVSYLSTGFGGGLEPEQPNTVAEVCLRQGSSSGASTLTLDNLQVAFVPEPSSAALLGLGLLALKAIRRRK